MGSKGRITYILYLDDVFKIFVNAKRRSSWLTVKGDRGRSGTGSCIKHLNQCFHLQVCLAVSLHLEAPPQYLEVTRHQIRAVIAYCPSHALAIPVS